MACSPQFWTRLKSEALGTNMLGFIKQVGDFEGVPGGSSKLRQGPTACCAEQTNAGFDLRPISAPCAHSVGVYWLPWTDKLTIEALRSQYEHSCDYFMTAKLEGCRFVLTDKKVLHIAANALGAEPGPYGSVIRTVAEGKKTEFAPSTRVSASYTASSIAEGHLTYGDNTGGGVSLVFGYRITGSRKWIYKQLKRPPNNAPEIWETIINPPGG